jgi:cell division protein FtsB
MLALVGSVGIAALFALAAFHAMLASGQAQLDQLESRVGDAQARYESLRLDVAELEAPDRIVREAQERLGMVPPPGVTYLTPSEAVTNEVGQAAVTPSPTQSDAGDRAAWATVKPYLSGRP